MKLLGEVRGRRLASRVAGRQGRAGHIGLLEARRTFRSQPGQAPALEAPPNALVGPGVGCGPLMHLAHLQGPRESMLHAPPGGAGVRHCARTMSATALALVAGGEAKGGARSAIRLNQPNCYGWVGKKVGQRAVTVRRLVRIALHEALLWAVPSGVGRAMQRLLAAVAIGATSATIWYFQLSGQSVRLATPICLWVGVTGVVNTPGAHACAPYGGSVSCNASSVGLAPTLVVDSEQCLPSLFVELPQRQTTVAAQQINP